MRCFVIGPIGDQLAEAGSPERLAYEAAVQIFEEVISAACKAFDVEAYRADDISDPGDIPEQIFEALRDEELVIADLSGANPNVMYELGVRHALGKCTLQIGEKGRLPFDINTIRTVQFTRTPTGLIKARNALTKMIGSSLANGCRPSTAARIIQAVAGTTDSPLGKGNDVAEVDSLSADVDEVEPLGFLDGVAELETNGPEMNDRLQSMAQLIKEMGTLASVSGEQATRSTTTGQRLSIMKRFSGSFGDLVRQYDQELVEFEGRVATIGAAVDAVLKHVELARPADANEYLGTLIGLGEVAARSRDEGMLSFRGSLDSIENLSRDLRPSVRLLRSDLDRTIAGFDEVERWGIRAGGLIVPDDLSDLDNDETE